MPSEPFLHERSDLKALVETVADSEKINDPALVLLVQHSGSSCIGVCVSPCEKLISK
jgi:hypothetical protein